MAYTIAEQETNIIYERETKLYTIYSTVPHHIRRLMKRISIFEVLHTEKDEKEDCIAIKVRGSKLPPFSTFK